MGVPVMAVSRLRRFIHGLATLAARADPTAPPDDPPRPEIGQEAPPGPSPTAPDAGLAGSSPTESPGQPTVATVEVVEAAPQPELPPTPPDARLQTGLWHIRHREWGRAQRALEEIVRRDAKCEAGAYLAEVRAVRRCLRQLSRWPRDPQLHLELGRLYFGLELGDEALHEFKQVVQIEPGLAEGHFYLAVEYLFRGDEEAARGACERARQLNPDLPSYDVLEGRLSDSQERREPARQQAG